MTEAKNVFLKYFLYSSRTPTGTKELASQTVKETKTVWLFGPKLKVSISTTFYEQLFVQKCLAQGRINHKAK